MKLLKFTIPVLIIALAVFIYSISVRQTKLAYWGNEYQADGIWLDSKNENLKSIEIVKNYVGVVGILEGLDSSEDPQLSIGVDVKNNDNSQFIKRTETFVLPKEKDPNGIFYISYNESPAELDRDTTIDVLGILKVGDSVDISVKDVYIDGNYSHAILSKLIIFENRQ